MVAAYLLEDSAAAAVPGAAEPPPGGCFAEASAAADSPAVAHSAGDHCGPVAAWADLVAPVD